MVAKMIRVVSMEGGSQGAKKLPRGSHGGRRVP